MSASDPAADVEMAQVSETDVGSNSRGRRVTPSYLHHPSELYCLRHSGRREGSVRQLLNQLAARQDNKHRMHSLSRCFSVREKPLLHSQGYKLLSRHRPALIEPVHEKVRKCNQRRRLNWRRIRPVNWGRIRSEISLLKLDEFGDHCEARL